MRTTNSEANPEQLLEQIAGSIRSNMQVMLPLVLVVASLCAVPMMAIAKDNSPIDFNRDIRPILSDRCFHCHGPAEKVREGGFRLDQRESALGKADSGEHPIVVGKPETSELIRRITAKDDEERMPPGDSRKKPLTAEQVELIRRWVEQGAEYQPHWAYVPPKAWPDPEVRDKRWPANWIDRFILSRLEAEGLRPAADADRVTLLRRLSFDLTGLPPTTKEVQAFVNDKSPDAYEKVVDRLLASPHYGERMAMWWLDLVRYADTVGYHGDQDHRSWPYRDWVIAAFNDNMPFDQYTIEQVAGDFLPEPTQAQLVATAYNRILQTTNEGGAQLKEYRAIYQADRIRNLSQVWMGATIGCAQCHNHMYDPYTMRDFYSLGAMFADIEEERHLIRKLAGALSTVPTVREPEMPYKTPAMLQQIAELESRIAAAKQKLAAATQQTLARKGELESTLRKQIAERQPTAHIWIDDVQDSGGTQKGTWNFVSADRAPVFSGKLSREQSADGFVQHYFQKAKKTITLGEDAKLFAWVYLDPKNPPQALMLQFNVNNSWEHRAVWGSNAITYGRKSESWQGYRHRGPLPKRGEWVQLDIAAKDIGLKPGTVVGGMAFAQFGGRAFWDRAGWIDFALFPPEVAAVLAIARDQRTGVQRQALDSYLLQQSPKLKAVREQVSNLTLERKKLDEGLPKVLYTKKLAKPRVVRILPRGNWLDESGEVVDPAIPEFLGKLDVGERRANRLDLARWLVGPRDQGGVGTLTARVQVNRFWQNLLGSGISGVLDDLGGQGEPPVHPELLDRLAIEFFDSGWDMKHMLKQIVMSRTYRQSSVALDELRKRDPDNRLYARQSPWRLHAELVRDNAMAISGLLVHDVGGPSVKPYQPAGYYESLNFPKRKYVAHADKRQWRRGLYMHWQRTFLHPMLKAMDAPNREECTAQRNATNTPTAALVLLNDPTFIEAARSLAARIETEGGDSDAKRLAWAFRQATSRTPDAREQAVLGQLLTQQRTQFRSDVDAAKKLLAVGLTPEPRNADPVELAAWTSVARVLLNLNETITRN